MRFVPVKSAEQQAALMLVGVRDRLIRTRTQLTNGIRGYAADPGCIGAVHSLQDRRQRQQPATLIGILRALRKPPKLIDRIVRSQFYRS
jgi:transposase